MSVENMVFVALKFSNFLIWLKFIEAKDTFHHLTLVSFFLILFPSENFRFFKSVKLILVILSYSLFSFAVSISKNTNVNKDHA